MDEAKFQELLKVNFGLEYQVIKQKLAYDMVMFNDDSDGTTFGPFAGHSHGCRLAGFEYKGWSYVYDGAMWHLQPDGIHGWRRGDNPFPRFDVAKRLESW